MTRVIFQGKIVIEFFLIKKPDESFERFAKNMPPSKSKKRSIDQSQIEIDWRKMPSATCASSPQRATIDGQKCWKLINWSLISFTFGQRSLWSLAIIFTGSLRKLCNGNKAGSGSVFCLLGKHFDGKLCFFFFREKNEYAWNFWQLFLIRDPLMKKVTISMFKFVYDPCQFLI